MIEGVDNLKSEVTNWSLASDIKFLEFLRQYSNKFVEKANNLLNNVEELNSDVIESEVGLRNTFNEFMMMSNTQFIENVCIFLNNFCSFLII